MAAAVDCSLALRVDLVKFSIAGRESGHTAGSKVLFELQRRGVDGIGDVRFSSMQRLLPTSTGIPKRGSVRSIVEEPLDPPPPAT